MNGQADEAVVFITGRVHNTKDVSSKRLDAVVGEECPSLTPTMEKEDAVIVQHTERTIVYEALLTQSQSITQVQAMRPRIERLGGSLRFEQTGNAVLVTLSLPAPYTADQFFPSAPFFPA